MKKILSIATITLMLAGVLATTNAQAGCKYDVVGNTQLAPTIALSGDGQVTFGMAAWWEDDVYACYNTFVTPAYLAYFGGCDLDGSGLVDFDEVLEIYNFVNKYPTGGAPAYAWQCPEDYDVSGSDVEWAASGICAEANGVAGPAICNQAQHSAVVNDMNDIIASYPWTEAVFDGYHGGGQSFAEIPYSLVCFTPSSNPLPADLFDSINSCYKGNTNLLPSGSFAIIEFDAGVNVWDAVNNYDVIIKTADPSALCELDELFMGSPTGFHATNDSGWTQWDIYSTAYCDYYGCGCDATAEIWSDGAGTYIEASINNNSQFGSWAGQSCGDARFNF